MASVCQPPETTFDTFKSRTLATQTMTYLNHYQKCKFEIHKTKHLGTCLFGTSGRGFVRKLYAYPTKLKQLSFSTNGHTFIALDGGDVIETVLL